jgi:hypothetical protein
MKHVLIRYHFTKGSPADWQKEVARFIAAIENDPQLNGKLSYRAMKTADGDYVHLASVVDGATVDALNERDFFDRYTEKTKEVGGGRVDVTPVEIVAETKFRG